MKAACSFLFTRVSTTRRRISTDEESSIRTSERPTAGDGGAALRIQSASRTTPSSGWSASSRAVSIARSGSACAQTRSRSRATAGSALRRRETSSSGRFGA